MNTVDLHSMTLPLAMLVIVAPIGGVDQLYFHLWRFRLYRVPSARAELASHLVRNALVACVAYLFATYRFGGAWFWAVGGLLVLDFLTGVVDTALEPRSRAPLGGVPALESVIHIVGSTFSGAITASYFLLGWADRLAPTALVPVDGSMPWWLVWQGRIVAAIAALLVLLELTLFARSQPAHRESRALEATTAA
ncbi:MAG: uncharacterized protein JWN48_549 [Myxococcaceae bacterium]|nr:uncharacterized protein [Myxococcaceae bacterium]